MGQTHSEKIQQALNELVSEQIISVRQFEAFSRDLSKGLGAIEIERFIENPTMENFLPEVIKKRYEAELAASYGPQLNNFRDQSCTILKTKAAELLQPMIKRKLGQINSNWQNISEKMCCLFIENDNENNIQKTLWKIVGEVLSIEWMEISSTSRKINEMEAKVTDDAPKGQSSNAKTRSSLLVIQDWKGKKNQFNLTPLIVNCRQNKSSAECYSWSVERTGRDSHIEAMFFNRDSELSGYLKELKEKGSKIYQILVKQFFKIQDTIVEQGVTCKQKKAKIVGKIFSLMRVFLGICLEFITKNVTKVVESQAEKIKVERQKQKIISQVTEEILYDFKQQINNKIQKLKQYSTKLKDQNTVSLFFNQYAILEFMCAQTDQLPIFPKIDSLLKQSINSQVRLYNLFPNNKKLRQKLSAASKGLLDQKITLETGDGVFFFYPCEDGKISYIVMEISVKQNQIKADNEQRFPISLNGSVKNSKKCPSGESPKNFTLQLEELSINFLKEKDENRELKYGSHSNIGEDMAEKTFDIFSKNLYFSKLSQYCKSKFKKFCRELIMHTQNGKTHLFSFTRTLDSLIWIQEFTSELTLSILGDLDIFCLLLSALALNLHVHSSQKVQNFIEGVKKPDISEFFNNIKPIQNECSRLFFAFLRRSSCNFLCQLKKQDFRKIRTSIIENILSSEEGTLEPFFIFKPKQTETQRILKSRWSCLILKCSRFSVFVHGNTETDEWIKYLNEHLIETKKAENLQIFEASTNLEKFEDKESYLKETALGPFKQIYSLLFKQIVKDEKMSKIFDKIEKNMRNLEKSCGIAHKDIHLQKNICQQREGVDKNSKMPQFKGKKKLR